VNHLAGENIDQTAFEAGNGLFAWLIQTAIKQNEPDPKLAAFS